MILVTGASGFIGSHLVEELIKENKKIKCLVLEKDYVLGEKIGKEREKILESFEVGIIYGDLLDKNSLEKALKGVDKVFHLGAIGRPMNIQKHLYYDINVQGIKNLLEACKKQKVKKIIHVSTMSVFGFSRNKKPLTENSPKLPISDYGKSKKQGEEFAMEFCKKNNIKLIIVRPPMVFGPRDFQFLKLFKLINTGFFPLLKKGESKMEFCYVENFVEGILLADKKGKEFESYNLSDGKTYTIKEVFEEIVKAEGKNLFPISPPVWSVRIAGKISEIISKIIRIHPPFNSGTALWMTNDNIMDISKAKKELGFKRKILLKESVKETIKWYKEKNLL